MPLYLSKITRLQVQQWTDQSIRKYKEEVTLRYEFLFILTLFALIPLSLLLIFLSTVSSSIVPKIGLTFVLTLLTVGAILVNRYTARLDVIDLVERERTKKIWSAVRRNKKYNQFEEVWNPQKWSPKK